MDVVGDGEEALEFLRGTGRHAGAPKPDMVILDLNLPRKDGREVLAEVKSDPVLKHLPVIVMTTPAIRSSIVRYGLMASEYQEPPEA